MGNVKVKAAFDQQYKKWLRKWFTTRLLGDPDMIVKLKKRKKK